MKRSSTPKTSGRDHRWLELIRRGKTTAQIAAGAGLSVRAVQVAIARARRSDASPPPNSHLPSPTLSRPRSPRAVPLFPVTAFTPGSACPHAGPIRVGSVLLCMVCHRGGREDHPALQRDPRTDPRPEKRPAAAAEPGRPETRREKRRKLYREPHP